MLDLIFHKHRIICIIYIHLHGTTWKSKTLIFHLRPQPDAPPSWSIHCCGAPRLWLSLGTGASSLLKKLKAIFRKKIGRKKKRLFSFFLRSMAHGLGIFPPGNMGKSQPSDKISTGWIFQMFHVLELRATSCLGTLLAIKHPMNFSHTVIAWCLVYALAGDVESIWIHMFSGWIHILLAKHCILLIVFLCSD